MLLNKDIYMQILYLNYLKKNSKNISCSDGFLAMKKILEVTDAELFNDLDITILE